jgi:hypothetical protein
VNHRSPSAGADFHRQSIVGDEPSTAWPVLARIPWIETPRAAGPVFEASNEETVKQRSSGFRAMPQGFKRIDGAASDRRDAEFDGARQYQSGASGHSQAGSAGQRFRIDLSSDSASEFPTPSAPHLTAFLTEQPSLAARIFQWQAGLPPHAGLAMAAALALAIGAMCWIDFSPRTAGPVSNTAKAPLWREQPASPLTFNDPEAPLALPEDLSQFSWAAKLLPAPVPAAIGQSPAVPLASESPKSLVETTDPKPTDEKTTPPESESPAPAAPVAATTQPNIDEPITPTIGGPNYPTTPFSVFDYESLRKALEPMTNPTLPSVVSVPGSPASR